MPTGLHRVPRRRPRVTGGDELMLESIEYRGPLSVDG